MDFVRIARPMVSCPILRKDFIVDEYQLFQAREIGANAVLLIAADLTKAECKQLAKTAHELGLETLLETHSEPELEYVGDNIDMVGVNNRNLGTLLKYGARFDMIGMSIYPYWSIQSGKEPDAATTITDCIDNIRKVSKKYSCDVMITETGFEVDEEHPEVMLEGRDQFRRLIHECRTLTDGHCRGIFYWEPECTPHQYRLGAFTHDGRPTEIMEGLRP